MEIQSREGSIFLGNDSSFYSSNKVESTRPLTNWCDDDTLFLLKVMSTARSFRFQLGNTKYKVVLDTWAASKELSDAV
jgi:hypothetical protein